MLGAKPYHHPFPILCTSHLTLSFQHPAFQHQFTSIPGSPRIVTRLPLPHSPNWSIIPLYFTPFSFILYHTHLTLRYHRSSQYLPAFVAVL